MSRHENVAGASASSALAPARGFRCVCQFRRSPAAALIASLRAAAHAAVDACDMTAAVALTQLIEERSGATPASPRPATPPGVASIDAARRRRREHGGK